MKVFFILGLLASVAGAVYEIPDEVDLNALKQIATAMKCNVFRADDKASKYALAQKEWNRLMNKSQRKWDRERVMAKECRSKAKRYNDCAVWWAYFGKLFDPYILCAPQVSQECRELVEKHFPLNTGPTGAPGVMLHIFPENVHVIYCDD